MYIRKIVSKNLGPIKKIQLLLPLENGVPKPVVLVGENMVKQRDMSFIKL